MKLLETGCVLVRRAAGERGSGFPFPFPPPVRPRVVQKSSKFPYEMCPVRRFVSPTLSRAPGFLTRIRADEFLPARADGSERSAGRGGGGGGVSLGLVLAAPVGVAQDLFCRAESMQREAAPCAPSEIVVGICV